MKTIETSFKSFAHMLEVLPTDEACRKFLEGLRWNNKPVCPHCGSQNENHYELKANGEFKGLRKCKDCRERFTVTVGTMFEGSHISLKKWFIAIYIFSAHKKGISSHQLARDLGITQKSAWFMLQRIRISFGMDDTSELTSEVEIDETYIGGKISNKHLSERKRIKNATSLSIKAPVLGLLERNGMLLAKVLTDVRRSTVLPIVTKAINLETIVYTDSSHLYTPLNKTYAHYSVNHEQSEYVRGCIHTNSIEGFWSQLKRGIIGIYHSTSKQHLQKYVDEFVFRYNTRSLPDGTRFTLSLVNAKQRVTYKELINK